MHSLLLLLLFVGTDKDFTRFLYSLLINFNFVLQITKWWKNSRDDQIPTNVVLWVGVGIQVCTYKAVASNCHKHVYSSVLNWADYLKRLKILAFSKPEILARQLLW